MVKIEKKYHGHILTDEKLESERFYDSVNQ